MPLACCDGYIAFETHAASVKIDAFLPSERCFLIRIHLAAIQLVAYWPQWLIAPSY